MRPQKFKLPCSSESFSSINLDSKVVIVSIFGKSQYKVKGCKSDMIGSILQLDLLDEPTVDIESMCEIEGYHDPQEKIIYLHLRGFLDTCTLINEFDEFAEKFDRKDFLSIWAHMRTKYARALLFLLHISHIVILNHPGHTFDYSYIHLFRALDIIRLKTAPQVSDILSKVPGISKEWVSHSRPCSPRMLFYFERCPEIFLDSKSEANIKKLEHSLEDKIYQLLRKNRIVTNICANSLFAIPANQEFVFICTEKNEGKDLLTYMCNELIKSCSKVPQNKLNNIEQSSLNVAETDHRFTDFLQQHITLALTKGFDDNVGRHVAPAPFQVPTGTCFFSATNKLYDFFLCKMDKESISLHGLLDTDVKFSKSRCTKVLPRAFQAYEENLPQYYTRAYHESKLAQAMATFEMHARGPLYEEFSEKLQRECEKHWRSGHQMCQVLSLTGNPCTNPIHRGGGDGAGGGEVLDSKDDQKDLSVMDHCSGVRYICACNCGRCQGSREDPFSLKQANYDYFQMLGIQCGCNQIESFVFPVFQPSTHNFRAAQLTIPDKKQDSSSRGVHSVTQYQLQIGSHSGNDEIDAYSSEGQSQPESNSIEGEGQRFSDKVSLTPNDENKVVIEIGKTDSEAIKEKSIIKQPSTTEYLPSMLNTESPPALLPRFSSWSLVCLGSSSIYSHNLGLQHQNGILPNSAFLLPWDVTVRLEHQKDKTSLWPINSDVYYQKGKNFQNANRGRKLKKGKELIVKIFIGIEYECPRGHRFMASAPDKVLKASGIGMVKENGNKVTSNDMPLYFLCPCRQTKPLVAQLMRIHIVTPKAPVHVTLNPRVQPGPSPCPIFITGCNEPMKLSQSAYWILRLPYVYVGEKGPYLPPKELSSINYGRLLAGVYGISEAGDKK